MLPSLGHDHAPGTQTSGFKFRHLRFTQRPPLTALISASPRLRVNRLGLPPAGLTRSRGVAESFSGAWRRKRAPFTSGLRFLDYSGFRSQVCSMSLPRGRPLKSAFGRCVRNAIFVLPHCVRLFDSPSTGVRRPSSVARPCPLSSFNFPLFGCTGPNECRVLQHQTLRPPIL